MSESIVLKNNKKSKYAPFELKFGLGIRVDTASSNLDTVYPNLDSILKNDQKIKKIEKPKVR